MKKVEKVATKLRWDITKQQLLQPDDTPKEKYKYKFGDGLRSINKKLRKLYVKNRVIRKEIEVTKVGKTPWDKK